MKKIIVSEKTSKILYALTLLFVILFFCYVYFESSDKKTLVQTAWSCGLIGVWAFMGLLGIRIITSTDIGHYGELYQKIIRGAFRDDKWNYARLIQAIYYYEHNKYKLAMRILNALLGECESGDDYCAVWILKAHIYRENNEYEQAILHFDQALRYDPNNFVLLTWQCVCCQKVNAIEKVIEICKKELEIDPGRDDAIYLLAEYYAKKDDDENASKYFEQYCQCDVPEAEVEELRHTLCSYGIFV